MRTKILIKMLAVAIAASTALLTPGLASALPPKKGNSSKQQKMSSEKKKDKNEIVEEKKDKNEILEEKNEIVEEKKDKNEIVEEKKDKNEILEEKNEIVEEKKDKNEILEEKNEIVEEDSRFATAFELLERTFDNGDLDVEECDEAVKIFRTLKQEQKITSKQIFKLLELLDNKCLLGEWNGNLVARFIKETVEFLFTPAESVAIIGILKKCAISGLDRWNVTIAIMNTAEAGLLNEFSSDQIVDLVNMLMCFLEEPNDLGRSVLKTLDVMLKKGLLNICPSKKRKDLVEKIRQCFNSESKVKDQMALVNFTVNNIEAMGEMDFGDLSKFSLRQLVDKLLSGPALSQQNEREVLNAILKKFDKNSKKELSSVERLSLIEKFMQSKLDFSNWYFAKKLVENWAEDDFEGLSSDKFVSLIKECVVYDLSVNGDAGLDCCKFDKVYAQNIVAGVVNYILKHEKMSFDSGFIVDLILLFEEKGVLGGAEFDKMLECICWIKVDKNDSNYLKGNFVKVTQFILSRLSEQPVKQPIKNISIGTLLDQLEICLGANDADIMHNIADSIFHLISLSSIDNITDVEVERLTKVIETCLIKDRARNADVYVRTILRMAQKGLIAQNDFRRVIEILNKFVDNNQGIRGFLNEIVYMACSDAFKLIPPKQILSITDILKKCFKKPYEQDAVGALSTMASRKLLSQFTDKQILDFVQLLENASHIVEARGEVAVAIARMAEANLFYGLRYKNLRNIIEILRVCADAKGDLYGFSQYAVASALKKMASKGLLNVYRGGDNWSWIQILQEFSKCDKSLSSIVYAMKAIVDSNVLDRCTHTQIVSIVKMLQDCAMRNYGCRPHFVQVISKMAKKGILKTHNASHIYELIITLGYCLNKCGARGNVSEAVGNMAREDLACSYKTQHKMEIFKILSRCIGFRDIDSSSRTIEALGKLVKAGFLDEFVPYANPIITVPAPIVILENYSEIFSFDFDSNILAMLECCVGNNDLKKPVAFLIECMIQRGLLAKCTDIQRLRIAKLLEQCATLDINRVYVADLVVKMVTSGLLDKYSLDQRVAVTNILKECLKSDKAKNIVLWNIEFMLERGLLDEYRPEQKSQINTMLTQCADFYGAQKNAMIVIRSFFNKGFYKFFSGYDVLKTMRALSLCAENSEAVAYVGPVAAVLANKLEECAEFQAQPIYNGQVVDLGSDKPLLAEIIANLIRRGALNNFKEYKILAILDALKKCAQSPKGRQYVTAALMQLAQREGLGVLRVSPVFVNNLADMFEIIAADSTELTELLRFFEALLGQKKMMKYYDVCESESQDLRLEVLNDMLKDTIFKSLNKEKVKTLEEIFHRACSYCSA